jgi:hypothetical protein
LQPFFKDHETAAAAVRNLAAAGLDIKHLSVVGNGPVPIAASSRSGIGDVKPKRLAVRR